MDEREISRVLAGVFKSFRRIVLHLSRISVQVRRSNQASGIGVILR